MTLVINLLPVIAALLASIAVLAFAFGLRRILRRDIKMESRLNTYLEFGERIDGVQADPEDGSALAERLNDVIKRQSFADRIEQDLGQADLPITVPEYVLIRVGVPLVLGIIALVIWRTIYVIPLAMLVGYIIPILWLRQRRVQRMRAFNDQLAETLALVSASMRGGFSLLQSVGQVAKDAPEPTRRELLRVGQEVQLGLSLTQALDNLVSRMESDDLDMAVTAIKIHARVGGNLTTILETISTTIRERARLRRDVRVITSMQRISSYVIGMLPIGLALIIFVINPTYISKLFLPGWTLCIPVGAVISWISGFLVIRKVVDIKV
ncbi:secretion system protein [Kouleothrix aurantiaca]|uniref:Secretion system protein n=1 Tax=Kouleothrix aurantiaca TaxID=186479 RepID=A0A0P9D5L0_9CHLR|nr:secretion system protein [Kouleothrix aurantiaca]